MPVLRRVIKPSELRPSDIGQIVEIVYTVSPDSDAPKDSVLESGFSYCSVGILKGYNDEVNSSDPFRPAILPTDLSYALDIVLDGFAEPVRANGNFEIIFH